MATDGDSIVAPLPLVSIATVAFFTATCAAGCGDGMIGANDVTPYESTAGARG
jgi:hypothetical protein